MKKNKNKSTMQDEPLQGDTHLVTLVNIYSCTLYIFGYHLKVNEELIIDLASLTAEQLKILENAKRLNQIKQTASNQAHDT